MTVLKLLQFIGAMSGGRTVTQVALAYLMGKGKPGSAIPFSQDIDIIIAPERWDEALIPRDYNLEGELTVLLNVPHRRNSHTRGKVCGASQGSHWRATVLSG